MADSIRVIKDPQNLVVLTGQSSITNLGSNPSSVIQNQTVNEVEVSSPGPQGPQGPPGDAGITDSLLRSFMAGEDLSGHQVVIRQADNTVITASNDALAEVHGPLWMTTEAASLGQPVEVLIFGNFQEPSWTWTPGQPIYLGLAGVMTQTPPLAPVASFLVQIAYATGPDSIFYSQGPAIKLM